AGGMAGGSAGGSAADAGIAFTLQILHASDQESGLPAVADAPRFSAVLARLEAEFPDATLKLANGDLWLPGVFLNAGADPMLAANPSILVPGPGRADVAIFNELGLHAASLGNHEFDNGTTALASIIRPDPLTTTADGGPPARWPGAKFPYLSANLDVRTDSNLAPTFLDGGASSAATATGVGSNLHARITPAIVLTVQGQRIGLVGATTPTITTISQPGGVTVRPSNPTDWVALAAELQPHIDAMTAAGIDKIILMAHMQQYTIEVDELPQRLRGVDVILAGGSHSTWADADDVLRAGDSRVIDYPQWKTSQDGKPIAVLNVGANWRYVGRFLARFNGAGELVRTPADVAISGVFATDEAGVNRLDAGALVNPRVRAICDAIGAVVQAKDGTRYGETSVFLNGRREAVRTRETNFGNLTADANLRAGKAVDPTTVISLKNGGGIRDSIGTVGTGAVPSFLPPAANPQVGKREGDVSWLDIENSLRFNNGLSLVTVSAPQLQLVMEHAFSGVRPGATPGSFPQVAGLYVEYDSAFPAQVLPNDGGLTPNTVGQRVRRLEVVDGTTRTAIITDGGFVGSPTATFRMVTLDFLAGGGDGYPFARFRTADAGAFNRVDLLMIPDGGMRGITTPGSEQRALADYFQAVHPLDGGMPYSASDTVAPARIVRLGDAGM
ncbi:MAG: bifunctional metallophosphatase/5'-nucleotidase, partial [Myxococcaceae bacterium]|nr:bifunctional metallophosphatase/5'-nucleotidase [Myxococcaceae bacterium]